MKPLFYTLFILLLSSCITSTDIIYNDPNYLKSTEFSSYNKVKKEKSIISDTTSNTQTDHYETDNNYYSDYSSRIRRFHRPVFYSNYYSGFYTNYHWHHHDPFWQYYDPYYYGSNIYFNYGIYDPFYYDYYNPFYFESHFSYSWNNHYPFYTYYQKKHHNQYTTGKRSSLFSNNNRKLKSHTAKPYNYNPNNLKIEEKNRPNNKNTYQHNSSRRNYTNKNRGKNHDHYSSPRNNNQQNNIQRNKSRNFNSKPRKRNK